MELDKQQIPEYSPEFSIEPYESLNEKQETISGERFPEHSIVMCDRCYWCCTCFNNRGLLNSCPLCFHGTSKIPLTIEENCKICYDKIHGFTMEFYRRLPLRWLERTYWLISSYRPDLYISSIVTIMAKIDFLKFLMSRTFLLLKAYILLFII